MPDLVDMYNKKNSFNIPFKDALQQAVSNAAGPTGAIGSYHTEFKVLGQRYFASVMPADDNEFAVFRYNGDKPDFDDVIYYRKRASVSFAGLISSVAGFIMGQIAVAKGIMEENK